MSILKKPLYKEQDAYGRLGFYGVILVIYLVTITISFILFSEQLKAKKEEVIREYYEIILNHSIIKLTKIIRQNFSVKENDDAVVKIKKSDIVVCRDKECKKSNLFEFSSIIDKYIPEYIHYRIDINRYLLHRNTKADHYQLEKNYHIDGHNQLSIFVTLDSKFEKNLEGQISKTFVINSISLTLVLLVFIVMYRLYTRRVNGYYFQYYGGLYNRNIEVMNKNYENEISNKERKLMQKIWNLEYRNKRDQELNRVFSKKANKLALAIHDQENNNNDKEDYLRCSSCSIILYQKNNKNEEINTAAIISDFSDRFSDSEDNIKIKLSSQEQVVKFSSKEFLYQIIYSTINCILFTLKEQLSAEEYWINCSISKDSKGLASLTFYYNGLPIRNEKDLMKLSNAFLQTNANPFCIGVNQIFHVLKQDNFKCLVGNDNLNYIKFSKKIPIKNEECNNIIKFKK